MVFEILLSAMGASPDDPCVVPIKFKLPLHPLPLCFVVCDRISRSVPVNSC